MKCFETGNLKSVVKNSKSDAGLYVQFGCGLSAPDGWLNFDSSFRLLIERTPIVRTIVACSSGSLFPRQVIRGDIVSGLPLPDGSCAGVYASHVLEHIPRDDLPLALANVAHLLRPGGVFRLIVPDLEWRARAYLDLSRTMPADWLLDSCRFHPRSRSRGFMGLARRIFGASEHLWMYDLQTLSALLLGAGFQNVRRCTFGDSTDPHFAEVEEHDRFIADGNPELAIEACRPF